MSLGRTCVCTRPMDALMQIGAVPHRVGTDFLPVLTEKLDPGYLDFIKRMKAMLDPNGIMNAFSWQ